MIRVIIADDHEIVRAGIKSLLEQYSDDIDIVAQAADGAEAYALVVRERPDVLLLDISMSPGQSGLIACERVAQDFPNTKILIITMFAEPEYMHFTLRGGASGYLLKNSPAQELVDAIKAVHKGETYIHPQMVGALAKELTSTSEDDLLYKGLSARELEILRLLAKGFTNKEISEQIHLSVKTIEAHRAKLYSKFRFKTRADLVAYALRHRLLDI